MKTIKYILAATLIGVALLTGCKKADTSQNDLSNPVANETIAGPFTNINYQLQILLPPAGGVIKWNSGSITENGLLFDGTHVLGNMLKRYEYASAQAGTFDLFSTADLGFDPVPMGFYWSGSFKVRLNASATSDALVLKGIFRTMSAASFTYIPVEFIVSEPVTLQSVWLNSLTINQMNYLATLSLDISQLTNGISASMLYGATETSGEIIITSTSNTGLYNIMINNLRNDMMQAHFSAVAKPANTVTYPAE